MRVLHCDHCQQLVFFENFQCLNCSHPLAYLPDLSDIASLEQTPDGLWRSLAPGAQGRVFRLCENYSKHNVCNWTVDADDPNPLCRACRLTRVIPDLDVPNNRERWYRLSVAKRRLVYSLLKLRLPIISKTDDPARGLAFEFLADPPDPQPGEHVMTGHDHGLITINIAEADHDERERRRLALHEPYRTLLGHFRHEVGHYYWDRLIQDSPRLAPFRELFGDEQTDYTQALDQHYKNGAPPDWSDHFVSAYASVHPWEDWAETWAHYLHMIDTLETAAASGFALHPHRPDEPALDPLPDPQHAPAESFDQIIAAWFPLAYLLNNLNRGLGLPDPYPFTLPPPAIQKLRFIHETIAQQPT